MAKEFSVFYVKEFPVERLTVFGEDGWHHDPTHPFNKYHYDDAVLEHIDNTFCEPIQILMRNEQEIVAGPSGVTRLYGLVHKRNWTSIPAIVSTAFVPPWLDTSVPITTLEQFRSYYRLEPKTFGFEEDGRAYHHNQNPNKKQFLETLLVSEETKKRLLTMLEEYEKR